VGGWEEGEVAVGEAVSAELLSWAKEPVTLRVEVVMEKVPVLEEGPARVREPPLTARVPILWKAGEIVEEYGSVLVKEPALLIWPAPVEERLARRRVKKEFGRLLKSAPMRMLEGSREPVTSRTEPALSTGRRKDLGVMVAGRVRDAPPGRTKQPVPARVPPAKVVAPAAVKFTGPSMAAALRRLSVSVTEGLPARESLPESSREGKVMGLAKPAPAREPADWVELGAESVRSPGPVRVPPVMVREPVRVEGLAREREPAVREMFSVA
jgi:hypothetical protein